MMAVYDLEEQEQISEIKAWWEKNGGRITAIATLALVSVAGWQGWQWYHNKNANEASALYATVLKAGAEGDAQKIRDAAGQILQQYGSTSYAYLGALTSGKVQAHAGELKNARSQLAWVVANAPDAAVRDIARLRLAAVQLDEENYADALASLSVTPVPELAAGFADLRGDILAAQGKAQEAVAAYRLALDALKTGGAESQLSELIAAKLESLGGQRS